MLELPFKRNDPFMMMVIEEMIGEEFDLLLRRKGQLSSQRIYMWSEKVINHLRTKSAYHSEGFPAADCHEGPEPPGASRCRQWLTMWGCTPLTCPRSIKPSRMRQSGIIYTVCAGAGQASSAPYQYENHRGQQPARVYDAAPFYQNFQKSLWHHSPGVQNSLKQAHGPKNESSDSPVTEESLLCSLLRVGLSLFTEPDIFHRFIDQREVLENPPSALACRCLCFKANLDGLVYRQRKEAHHGKFDSIQ